MDTNNKRTNKKGLAYILAVAGPGAIMAATGIGPSSLITSANAGANYGYNLVWWMIIILIFQMLFSYAANKYSTVNQKPAMVGIRENFGKGWAIVGAIATMIGQTTFCIGNFIGSGLGFAVLFPGLSIKVGGCIACAICIAFLFLKNLYKKVEVAMKVLVGIMVIVFIIALICSLSKGTNVEFSHDIIGFPAGSFATMISLLGATAHLAGGCYHSSLTREKGYTVNDIKRGGVLADSIVYVGVLGIVSICCMLVGANILPAPVPTAGGLGDALTGVIGPWIRPVFGIGLLSAAISSYLIAPKLGINLLLQAVGRDTKMDDKLENIIAIAMMLFGLVVGLIAGGIPTQLLAAVSCGNVVGMPIFGIMLILLSSRKKIMGEYKNKLPYTIGMIIAYIFIMFVVVNNVISLIGQFGH